jgi:hypothetical protein
MKKIGRLVIVALVAAAVAPAAASGLKVSDAVICRDVQDRTPIEPGDSFPSDVGKLFCFTRILGAQEETQVTHVWFLNDRQISLVNLKVGSPNWRTWSSKNILPEWVGDWKVEIRDADGNVIHTLEFTTYKPGEAVESAGEEESAEEEATEAEEESGPAGEESGSSVGEESGSTGEGPE